MAEVSSPFSKGQITKYARTLKRRADHLAKQIENQPHNADNGWIKAELAALNFAVKMIVQGYGVDPNHEKRWTPWGHEMRQEHKNKKKLV